MLIADFFTVLRYNSKKAILRRLSFNKRKHYYRKGTYSEEIIWDGRRFLFPDPKKKMGDGMWVFRNVQNDALDYANGKRIKEKPKLPVNYWNPKRKYVKSEVSATDVDHAYWRIAFLDGIISQKTYDKGLLVKDKAMRLAALANLASSKEYQVIKDGQITDETIILKYSPIMHKVYNNIRYTCFEHMMNMANLLGDDFICYKTDCIYYKSSESNRQLVEQYLDSASLYWKHLKLVETPNKKEINPDDDTYKQL